MDLRRGLRENTDTDSTYQHMRGALFFWRFNHVNPKWGFYIGPLPHLLVTPKKPAELIEWIDIAIQQSGVKNLVEQRFKLKPAPVFSK